MAETVTASRGVPGACRVDACAPRRRAHQPPVGSPTPRGPLLVKTPVRTGPRAPAPVIATTRRARRAGCGRAVSRLRDALAPLGRAARAEFCRGEPATRVAGDGPRAAPAFAADLGGRCPRPRLHRPWFGDALGAALPTPGPRHAILTGRMPRRPGRSSAGRRASPPRCTAPFDATAADEPPSLTHGDLWRRT